jgi:putative ABC transport system ATP-binding protein
MLTADGVCVSFGETVALAGASVTVHPGEMVALMGASGSGKSTLLYCLSGLVQPDEGSIVYNGRTLNTVSRAERSRLRREDFGFVFQFAELVPELSLYDNISLPLELKGGASRKERRDRVRAISDRLGILKQLDRRSHQVSGGQAQRAAVARALVGHPTIVFADEPTGALDSQNADVVLQSLLEVAAEVGSAVVVATHDAAVANAASRTERMADGVVLSSATAPC